MANLNTGFLDDLTIEDIRPEHADVAETIGLEQFKKLIKLCGGVALIIPSVGVITRDIRNRHIVEDYYNGGSIKELVRKYELTNDAIYKILRKSRKAKKQ